MNDAASAVPSRVEGDLPGIGPALAPRSQFRWRWRVLSVEGCSILVLLAVLCVVAFGRAAARHRPAGRFSGSGQPLGVLPGEFEHQQAILLTWPRRLGTAPTSGPDQVGHQEDSPICHVVRAIYRSIDTIILTEDLQSQERATRVLSQAGVPPDAVRFVQVPSHSPWIRDYGPAAVRAGDGSYTLIDSEFVNWDFISLDPHEDRLPSALGALLNMRTVRVPVAVQHGNLLSNGRGLCIATRRLLYDNAARGYDADDVARSLQQCFGAEELVLLESLEGELTEHVDMFATFTSPNTVVVGSYSPQYDRANAAILDRNARRLASLGPPCGPLNVVRIPMPPKVTLEQRGMVLLPTYTNVVYANGTLLVPVYPHLDPEGESFALTLYRRLLPDWTVLGVDTRAILASGGGIRCVTMNLASLASHDETTAEDRPD